MLAIIVVVVAASLAGGVLTFAIGLPNSPCSGVTGSTRSFTVIADSSGYNDSKDHQAPWPVITVNRCDTVSIKITNTDTQTHGFAIEFYAVRGTEIQGGGQSVSFQFLASKMGQFRMYCIVPCTVHLLYMQHGQLNVN